MWLAMEAGSGGRGGGGRDVGGGEGDNARSH